MSLTQAKKDFQAALLRALYDEWWQRNKHRPITYRVAWTAGYQKAIEDKASKEIVGGQ